MCKCSYSVYEYQLVFRTKSESRNGPRICAYCHTLERTEWLLYLIELKIVNVQLFSGSDQLVFIDFKNGAPNQETNLKVVCILAFLRGLSYCSVWLIEQCVSVAI